MADEGDQENTKESEDEEPIVTRMIVICARGRGPRDEALASHSPLLRNQELLDTSTEEDAEGMEQGEIEYLGTEATEVAVGEAVVDGEAVREEEKETL